VAVATGSALLAIGLCAWPPDGQSCGSLEVSEVVVIVDAGKFADLASFHDEQVNGRLTLRRGSNEGD
jgi:hypothetical protein